MIMVAIFRYEPTYLWYGVILIYIGRTYVIVIHEQKKNYELMMW